MSLFKPKTEQRSISFQQVWGSGADSINGNSVERAFSLVPVFGAVRLVADSVATLPLHAFRSDGNHSVKITPPSLVSDPTMFGTSVDWVHQAMTSLMLRGNAYGLVVERDGMGFATRVEWLNPDEVSVDDDRAVNRPQFRWLGQPLAPSELVHIKWMAAPGRVLGLSPVKAYALTTETGLAARIFGRDFLTNGATPSAMLMNDKPTDEDGAKRVRDRFKAAVRGREPVVMTGGWTYAQVSVSAEESQFLATIKATATDIATIYGIPPEMIGGESGSSMTYANVEQNAINFVQFTLRPYLVRLETAISRLLPARQFVQFNADALIRTDLLTRYRAHTEGLTAGWLSVDEVREIEDRPPLRDDAGKKYLWPPRRSQLSELEIALGADDESGQNDAMDALALEMQRLEAEAKAKPPQLVGVAASNNGVEPDDS